MFETIESYYSALFHEMGHATGHKLRLNRDSLSNVNNFDKHEYSKEELVAELTSAFLLAHSGINTEHNQAASYCEGWLKVLNSDMRFFVVAASQAQKAADYILNVDMKPSPDDTVIQ